MGAAVVAAVPGSSTGELEDAQVVVLGMTDLMDERTSVKADYRMDRTTVRAEGNNPFKWARPQRLAVDLRHVLRRLLEEVNQVGASQSRAELDAIESLVRASHAFARPG